MSVNENIAVLFIFFLSTSILPHLNIILRVREKERKREMVTETRGPLFEQSEDYNGSKNNQ